MTVTRGCGTANDSAAQRQAQRSPPSRRRFSTCRSTSTGATRWWRCTAAAPTWPARPTWARRSPLPSRASSSPCSEPASESPSRRWRPAKFREPRSALPTRLRLLSAASPVPPAGCALQGRVALLRRPLSIHGARARRRPRRQRARHRRRAGRLHARRTVPHRPPRTVISMSSCTNRSGDGGGGDGRGRQLSAALYRGRPCAGRLHGVGRREGSGAAG